MKTSTISTHATRLMKLFEGYSSAYGTYTAKSGTGAISRGKVEIKTTARTVREPPSADLWQEHLDGTTPLGIMPIRKNNTVLWGCIDIDSYQISHTDLVNKLEQNKIPMIVCKSKSGGAHLFLFMREPAPAGDVQDFLREVSVVLGWGSSEVFPKQREVHWDRGDLGSWLNMPYFEGDESSRYAVGKDGLGMTVRQFLDLAESMRQPLSILDRTASDFRSPTDPKFHGDFGDAPPCMQYLSGVGYPEGTRNKGLLALGVFAKKKFGTKWGEVLEQWNRELFDPPLPAAEVIDIIRRLEKKDYYYTCKEQPLLAHCNSAVCRTRRFGVGGDDDFPVISGMSVLDTEPPLWFLDVEDQRIELTTEELQNYRSFHKVCMEQLFRCYRMMKQDAWLQIIGDAMRSAVRIEAPKEVGETGQFFELLSTFLTDRHAGETKEDLLVGRPFYDETERRYYFRLQDLHKHLENANFRSFTKPQMATRIRRMQGESYFFNIKNKGVNVWWLPASIFEVMPTLDTPYLDEDPL